MASIKWTDAQVRFIINERKERNVEYYATPNKKKRLFWDNIAEKLNEVENTNYFTGEDCRKKFSNLTKAFGTAERYRNGTGTKKSLIGDEIYDEFSSRFWVKPELQFEQIRNENIGRSGSSSSLSQQETAVVASSSERKRPERSSKETPKVVGSSGETPVELRRPTTPSVETPTISRPVTPTLPSFSQSANVINVTINYSGVDSKAIDSDERQD